MLRGEIVPNGTVKDKNGNDITEDGLSVHGISVCTVPVGFEVYVREYLSQKADKIEFQYKDISEMLDPVKWCHPEIPTRQMLWLLTIVCLQNLGDYLIRHIRPDWTETFAKRIDKYTDQILGLYSGMKVESWSTYAQEQMAFR